MCLCACTHAESNILLKLILPLCGAETETLSCLASKTEKKKKTPSFLRRELLVANLDFYLLCLLDQRMNP